MQKTIGISSDIAALPKNLAPDTAIRVLAMPKPDSDYRLLQVERNVSTILGNGERSQPRRESWHWLTMPSRIHVVLTNPLNSTIFLVNTLDPIAGTALPKVPETVIKEGTSAIGIYAAAKGLLDSLGVQEGARFKNITRVSYSDAKSPSVDFFVYAETNLTQWNPGYAKDVPLKDAVEAVHSGAIPSPCTQIPILISAIKYVKDMKNLSLEGTQQTSKLFGNGVCWYKGQELHETEFRVTKSEPRSGSFGITVVSEEADFGGIHLDYNKVPRNPASSMTLINGKYVILNEQYRAGMDRRIVEIFAGGAMRVRLPDGSERIETPEETAIRETAEELTKIGIDESESDITYSTDLLLGQWRNIVDGVQTCKHTMLGILDAIVMERSAGNITWEEIQESLKSESPPEQPERDDIIEMASDAFKRAMQEPGGSKRFNKSILRRGSSSHDFENVSTYNDTQFLIDVQKLNGIAGLLER